MRFNLCLLLLAGVVAFGCGRSDAPKEITETRAVTPAPAESPHGAMAAKGMESPHGAPPTRAFMFATPEGWTQVPATPMRSVNFKVGPAPQAECYVSVLKGTGGGAAMNINRWRGQMGIEDQPLDADAIAKLPKIKVLGHDAPLVEAAGAYTGMDGAAQPNYMLWGAVCEQEEESVFIKMIGPESTVRPEKDHFIAFCESLN